MTDPRLLIAIRSDLKRVARQTHGMDGIAPSLREYREQGRFSDVKVRAAVGGYRTNHGERSSRYNRMGTPPRLGWLEAVRKYGLTPFKRVYQPTDRAMLMDLKRVALKCGHPLRMASFAEYREHGNYAGSALMRRFGKWNDVAAAAGLEPNKRGGDTPYHRKARSA